MQDKLNEIIERHCVSLKRNVEDLSALLRSVADGTAPSLPSIEEAEALAHQLKGGSGTAGFAEISRAATALDDHLKTLLAAPETANIAGIGTALTLSEALSRIAAEATPAHSKLYSLRV